MSELKPCPFCGGEAVETFAGVSCTECGGTMHGGVQYGGADWDGVIDAWNTRSEGRRGAALEDLVRDMYGFIDAACKKYPRMFDPNTGAGGQMVREMPNDRYAERMRELGVEQ